LKGSGEDFGKEKESSSQNRITLFAVLPINFYICATLRTEAWDEYLDRNLAGIIGW
jgi:hypothetical protein